MSVAVSALSEIGESVGGADAVRSSEEGGGLTIVVSGEETVH